MDASQVCFGAVCFICSSRSSFVSLRFEFTKEQDQQTVSAMVFYIPVHSFFALFDLASSSKSLPTLKTILKVSFFYFVIMVINTGALLGASFGADAMPEDWREAVLNCNATYRYGQYPWAKVDQLVEWAKKLLKIPEPS